MRIGIDVDDTIVKTTESMFSVMKKYNINEEVYYKEFNHPVKLDFLHKYHDEIILYAELKDGVVDVLKELNLMGHTLVIITARNSMFGKYAVSNVYDIIEKYNLPIEKVYYNEQEKYDVCLSKKIDLMIDDNSTVCSSLYKNNIDYLMMDSLFNKDIDLKRVYDWNEILDYVKKKERYNE